MHSLSSILSTAVLGALAVSGSRLVPEPAKTKPDVSVYGGADAAILQWPSDWGRNTYSKPIHDHNGYWRDAPVLEALSYGVMSTESDVWLYKDELYVGHDQFALSKERTFHDLTIKPLLAALDQANKANANYSKADPAQAGFFKELQQSVATKTSTPWTGYWSLGDGASAPIQLLIDIKTDGNKTWPVVVKQLEPLRQLGWLTRYENGKIIPGPVTIIGTGNTPINQVAPLTSRDYFFDCPLGGLNNTAYTAPDGTAYEYNSTLCGIASVNFRNFSPNWSGLTDVPDDVRQNLTAPIEEAHAKGIKSRYWGTIGWPVYARLTVDKLLMSLGSDWLNADDLDYAANHF